MRLPRFRLRTLFLIVAVFGVAAGFVTKRIVTVAGQRAAVAKIISAGGRVRWDYEFDDKNRLRPNPTPYGPEWLRKLLGDDAFSDVVDLDWGRKLSDSELDAIAHLPSLRMVLLSDLSDDALARLLAPGNLEIFCYRGSELTNRSIHTLAQSPRLRELTLDWASIDDEALQEIVKLKQLTHLILPNTPITGKDISRLSELPNLIFLDLSNTQIRDESATEIAKLQHLKYLSVAGTELTDVGISKIATMKGLASLCIGGTKATDQSIEVLAKMPKLTFLKLEEIALGKDLSLVQNGSGFRRLSSPFSNDGLTRLKTQRPDIHVPE